MLRSSTGKPRKQASTNRASFVDALKKAMSEARDIELVCDSGSRMSTRCGFSIASNRIIYRTRRRAQLGRHLQAMRHRSRQAAASNGNPRQSQPKDQWRCTPAKIDKSVLTISEPKRHRSKEHLQYVAQQPCLICGRSPSHAHHIRFAQSKGLALKVSDEFTVPLCAIHHSENHSTGDERRWWQKHNIDPLAIARRLWEESCKRGEHSAADQGDTGIAALST